MATEKTLNTRIQLKYDSYANWTSTTIGNDKGANFVLKTGEIGICYLPTGNSEKQVTGSQPPQILFKVGNGSAKFSELPWASAKAADVYEWAKQASLPVTKEGNGNVVAGITWDESTKGIKFTTASVATSEGMEQLANRVTAIENGYATDGELAAAVEAINASLATKADKTALDAVSAVANAAATQASLTEEINRAKAAEKANADAIERLTNGISQEEIDSVNDLINYVNEHGPEVEQMQTNIAANTKAISDEAARADTEEKRLAGLISTNSQNIQSNTNAITALNITDGKVAAAGKADTASSLDAAGIAQVKTIVVNKATDADTLDGHDSTYFATSAQGAKADSALQSITTTANGGLKITNKNQIDIDTDIVFVFNCGNSQNVI